MRKAHRPCPAHAQERPLAAEPVSASATMEEAVPAHFVRNAIAFVVDISTWLFAMSFIGAGTVMPGLIAQLTPHSEIYVGLLNALISGLWLLPQLAVAGIIT